MLHLPKNGTFSVTTSTASMKMILPILSGRRRFYSRNALIPAKKYQKPNSWQKYLRFDLFLFVLLIVKQYGVFAKLLATSMTMKTFYVLFCYGVWEPQKSLMALTTVLRAVPLIFYMNVVV
jgi:hypothetical protein